MATEAPHNSPRLFYSCASSGEILREYQQLNIPLGSFDASRHWAVAPSTPLSAVLAEMSRRSSDVAVVVDETNAPLGIFTQRDLLGRVVIPRLDLDQPISRVMTPDPVTLAASALGYEAIVAMVKGGFHHIILVTDGRVVGTVSEHDLFTIQQVSLGQIAAKVNSAADLNTVRSCAAEIRSLVEYMFVQGVAPEQVTQIISTLNDQLMRRVIDLEMAALDLREIKTCWIILGSEGRYEQTIATDQDNAIIFDHPSGMTADEARERLLPVARRVNQALHEIGFPLCKGNVMAGNPDCCLSLLEWKRKFHSWIAEPTPESLLNISIYFDFRALQGATGLADDLRLWLTDATLDQKRFLNLMTEVALQKTPPFTFLNSIFQENHPEVPNSIDIKVRGVSVFVDAARVYALASGIPATRTNERLLQTAHKRHWPDNLVSAWMEAFSFLQGIRIRHQHHLQNNGLKTHNRLDVCKLNSLEQKVCAEAFRQAGKLQKQLEDDFMNNFMGGSVSGA
jgi:CBS domain-containing protein